MLNLYFMLVYICWCFSINIIIDSSSPSARTLALNLNILYFTFLGYLIMFFFFMKTGSGKTYNMGTNYNGEEDNGGIIPKVMELIFTKVEAMKDKAEFLIRVSFIEVMELIKLCLL